MHCFNESISPLRGVGIHATRVNGLSVQSVRGVLTLFKDNQQVEVVSLETFLAYLDKIAWRVKSAIIILIIIISIFSIVIGLNKSYFQLIHLPNGYWTVH